MHLLDFPCFPWLVLAAFFFFSFTLKTTAHFKRDSQDIFNMLLCSLHLLLKLITFVFTNNILLLLFPSHNPFLSKFCGFPHFLHIAPSNFFKSHYLSITCFAPDINSNKRDKETKAAMNMWWTLV